MVVVKNTTVKDTVKKHYRQFRKYGHILDSKIKYDHCTVDDCTNKHYAKGYCQKHYNQVRRCGNIIN